MDPTQRPPSDPSPLDALADVTALLDTLPWGVLVLDAQHRIQRVNQQVARWAGLPAADLLQHLVADAPFPPGVRTALLQVLAPAAAPQEVFLTASAQWVVFSATRRSEGWVVYGQDITPQKQREQQYQTLAENTPDVLTRWTPDLRLQYANAAFVNTARRPLTAALGCTPAELGLPAAVSESYQDALRRVFATGQLQEHTHAFDAPWGTVQYQVRLVPELRDGAIETVLGIGRDITRLKQAEAEALRQSEEKYRTLFDSIDEGFAFIDLVDDATGRATAYRFVEANQAFERQTGYVGVMGQLNSEVSTADESVWVARYDAVARTGESQQFEDYHAPTDRWYLGYASRVGDAGSRQVALVFNDITERKRREQQQAFLLLLSDALRSCSDAREIEQAVTAEALRFFEADRCYYCTIEAGAAIIRHDACRAGLLSIAGTYPLHQFDLFNVVLATGQPFVAHDVHAAEVVNDALLALLRQVGIQAFLNVPVVKAGQVVGVFTVAQGQPRTWTEADLAVAAETAERTWVAVERARAEEGLRASEAALRRSEHWLQSALKGTRMGTFDYHLATDRITLTPASKDVFGLLPAQDLPTTGEAFHIVHPDDVARHRAAFLEAVAKHAEYETEYRVVRPRDGRVAWIAERGSPVVDADGEAYMRGIHWDITARKQAEQDLATSEQRLQTLIANLPGAAVFIIDRELRYQQAEGEALHQMGYTAADFRGRLVRETVPPEQWPTYREQYTQALADQPFEGEHEQGGRTFLTRGVPLPGPDGAVEAVLAVSYDITARQQAEAALRAAEARHLAELEEQVAARTRELRDSRDLLQTVFDTNLIAMSVLEAVRDDTGAIQDFRLVLVSQELERETGRTDLEGQLYTQEYPGIRAVGIFDLIVETVETGQPRGMEYFYPHEGFDKWYACQFVKLGDGAVATNLDITERKTAEQERLKNLRLLKQAEAVAGLGSWDYELATGTMRWSEGMYQLVNLPLGQPVSLEVYLQLVVDEDRPRAEQLVRQLTTGHSAAATLRLQVGEQVKTVRLKAVVLRDEAGRPARVLGVDLDITELQRLEADNLRLRLTQQQALFEAMQAAQEEERRRIAEGLHNGIGQLLYATKLRLDQLPTYPPNTDPEVVVARHEATQLLSEAIRQTRSRSHELMPLVLEKFGLVAALQDIGTNLSSPQLRLHTHVELDADATPLTPALQLALYRMAQELTQNVVKHAHGATEASLELETMPGWLLLRVEDNGPGFAAVPAADAGLGLRSIRDRVALLRGQLRTGSTSTGGAYVRIRIPYPDTPPA